MDVLEELREQADNQETRSKSYSIINLISRFEFISLLYFWEIILAKINRVQKRLQDKSMIFFEASKDINNLKIFFSEERENIIKFNITKSTKYCIELQISTERRIRVRKHMDGESRNVEVVSYTQELSRAMFSIIDRIISEFNNRFLILYSLNDRFGIFMDMESLLALTDCIIMKHCDLLEKEYPNDISSKKLCEEIIGNI